MGHGGQVYAMLQPWDDTTSTWNLWVNGIQPDGTEAAITPTVVAGNSGLTPIIQGTVNSLEVTTDVQAWANGSRPNYGWVILPWPGGTDGWGSRSSEYTSLVDELNPAQARPRLRVYFTTGVIAVPAVIQKPLVSATQVQVNFTGTAGKTYTVFRAPAVNGTWTSIGTAIVDGNGAASFNDAAPLTGSAFYKVIYQ